MRVKVDDERCQGHGLCRISAPDLFFAREEDGNLVGEVLWIDRYGNVQLNIDEEELTPFGDALRIAYQDKSRVVRRAAAYASVRPGDIAIVIDAYGLMSLAADRSSAADSLRLRPGDSVVISRLQDGD